MIQALEHYYAYTVATKSEDPRHNVWLRTKCAHRKAASMSLCGNSSQEILGRRDEAQAQAQRSGGDCVAAAGATPSTRADSPGPAILGSTASRSGRVSIKPHLSNYATSAATSCCVRVIAYRRQSSREKLCRQGWCRFAKLCTSFHPWTRCVCPYRPPCHPSSP